MGWRKGEWKVGVVQLGHSTSSGTKNINFGPQYSQILHIAATLDTLYKKKIFSKSHESCYYTQ